MAARTPLTVAEKERSTPRRSAGAPSPLLRRTRLFLPNCAQMVARRRDSGRAALAHTRRGRAATGVLSRFPPALTSRALNLKREHPAGEPIAC